MIASVEMGETNKQMKSKYLKSVGDNHDPNSFSYKGNPLVQNGLCICDDLDNDGLM